MGTPIVYWGYIEILENENGNYHSKVRRVNILGLYTFKNCRVLPTLRWPRPGWFLRVGGSTIFVIEILSPNLHEL